MPHQVSVFLENKPGKLERVTDLLANEGINIRAITVADSGDFGILKLLVDDPAKAYNILTQAGLVVAYREVLAVLMADRPGALLKVARILRKNEINIDDAYGFILSSGKSAVFVVQVKDAETAKKYLVSEGLELLDEKDLYRL